MNTLPDYTEWEPISIEEVGHSLKTINWILAGGYALEVFVNESYRKHNDIDITIDRNDQKKLSSIFNKNRIFVAEIPGILFPFNSNKFYKKPIQDIWILSEDLNSWCLQIMLIDCISKNWVYKRNESIKLPFSEIYLEKEGLKFIKPEIQLLYKSQSVREKDQIDFEKIYPQLEDSSKLWFQHSLKSCYHEHPWMDE